MRDNTTKSNPKPPNGVTATKKTASNNNSKNTKAVKAGANSKKNQEDNTKKNDGGNLKKDGEDLDCLDEMSLKDLLKESIRKNSGLAKSIAGLETKLDTAITELKQDNKELHEKFDRIKATVEGQAQSIEFNSSKIQDVEKELANVKTDLAKEIETVAGNGKNMVKSVKKTHEDIKGLSARITAAECNIDKLHETNPDKKVEEFPVSKTIVLQRVLYEEDGGIQTDRGGYPGDKQEE